MASISKIIAFVILSLFISLSQAAEKIQPSFNEANVGSSDSISEPIFKINGFSNIGISHSSQSLGDYVIDNSVPKGPGLSENWSFANDTKLGVQLTGDLSPQISSVLQIVSEYQPNGTYNPEVQWANVKYAFDKDIYIRAGRIAIPTFLYSDTRKIGYSYPWIHPPVDVYSIDALTNSDGMDALYSFGIAQARNSITVFAGKGFNRLPTVSIHRRNMRLIADSIEYGSALFRISYQDRQNSNDLIYSGAWIATSDLTVSASYDPGNWFLTSEWIQRKSNTLSTAMYISSGIRVKKFTPYLTYSLSNQASFIAGLPPPSATDIQNSLRSQNTTSLGVRWDFMKNTDFKLQFDQVHLGDNSNGFLANVPAGVNLYGTTFIVTSAVLDFVF